MFLTEEAAVDAPFDLAAARLIALADRGGMHGASENAYEGGLATVLRVGPFGGVRGFSKLVRVRVLDPARRSATVVMPLRWEATGATGDLFPVLDADLILARDGADGVRLALTGSYRPPFGRAGAVLDRTIMRRLATATIRSLLDDVSAAISEPAPEPEPGLGEPGLGTPPRWRPVTGPGES